MLTLLLDVDGVVADNVTASLGIVADLTGKQYAPADVTSYDYGHLLDGPEQVAEFWRRFNAPGFCASLQPFPGAVEAVTGLMRDYDVCFVTSPSASITWAGEREAWLKERFGATRKQIVSTNAKFRVFGHALVDDSPEHVEAWAEVWPSGLGLVWSRPYNAQAGGRFWRTNTWDGVRVRMQAWGGA